MLGAYAVPELVSDAAKRIGANYDFSRTMDHAIQINSKDPAMLNRVQRVMATTRDPERFSRLNDIHALNAATNGRYNKYLEKELDQLRSDVVNSARNYMKIKHGFVPKDNRVKYIVDSVKMSSPEIAKAGLAAAATAGSLYGLKRLADTYGLNKED